jgi:SAM-dependent methyltransferase
MHRSAMSNAKLFFDTYSASAPSWKVLDIGSQDVNGSLREVCPKGVEYLGVDFVKAKGVDVVLTDPYHFPFEDNFADMVVSSSCFEHSEMFWVLFLEILRVLKPQGVFYLNVPSNGVFHRYPVDCWRFFPDSGQALVNWAKLSGYPSAALLESYTSYQDTEVFNDFVAIFIKDDQFQTAFPKRILHSLTAFSNGRVSGNAEILNLKTFPEDLLKLQAIQQIAAGKITIR